MLLASFRRSCPALLLLALTVARASESPTPTTPGFDQWLLAPIRVHLLQSTNIPAIHTTLKEADIERILRKVNAIWSQAGISFWIESIVRENATTNSVPLGEPGDVDTLLDIRPMDSRDPGRFHLYFVKYFSIPGVYLGPAIFVKDTARLRYIPGIAGGGADEALPKVVAHELGHALSLQHTKILNRVMMDNATTGTNLSAAEIEQARIAARKFNWIETAPMLLQRARSQPEDSPTARALYRQLSVIPLDHPQVRRAREQAAEPQEAGSLSPAASNSVARPGEEDFRRAGQTLLSATTAKERSAAVAHYRTAALAGHAEAQYNLANAYEYGIGVATNTSEALIWYHKALTNGHAGARARLVSGLPWLGDSHKATVITLSGVTNTGWEIKEGVVRLHRGSYHRRAEFTGTLKTFDAVDGRSMKVTAGWTKAELEQAAQAAKFRLIKTRGEEWEVGDRSFYFRDDKVVGIEYPFKAKHPGR